MITVYVDFDNTIVESNKKIIEILNNKYHTFKTEDDLFDYNYNSIYPITTQEKKELFESDEFYNGLEFKPGFLNVLNTYNSIYNFVIVSKGTRLNLEKKKKWIKNNLGENFQFIGLEMGDRNFNKNKIDMEGSIQIDDIFDCLKTNAMLKILYKSYNDFPWQQPNSTDEYLVTNSWNEIDSILSFYHEYDCKTLKKR